MSLAALSKALKDVERIDKILIDSRIFNFMSKDLQLRCLEAAVHYSVVLAPKVSLKTGRPLSFDGINLSRMSILSSPGFSEEPVSKIEGEGGLMKGFVLDPRRLDDNAQEFAFRFQIECETETLLKDLVRRDHQVDTAGENNTYWLHAQLTDLRGLKDLLRRMSLLDIPFIVNVAVHQDVKTRFPARRRRELELIAQWARELDRNRKMRLSYQHLELKRGRPREKDITRILDDLQKLFMPHAFKKFVEVLEDFRYWDCYRGAEFYDEVPFRTFPKWMTVTCRTDMSLEKPASHGQLVYKRTEFQGAVEKAITKK